MGRGARDMAGGWQSRFEDGPAPRGLFGWRGGPCCLGPCGPQRITSVGVRSYYLTTNFTVTVLEEAPTVAFTLAV